MKSVVVCSFYDPPLKSSLFSSRRERVWTKPEIINDTAVGSVRFVWVKWCGENGNRINVHRSANVRCRRKPKWWRVVLWIIRSTHENDKYIWKALNRQFPVAPIPYYETHFWKEYRNDGEKFIVSYAQQSVMACHQHTWNERRRTTSCADTQTCSFRWIQLTDNSVVVELHEIQPNQILIRKLKSHRVSGARATPSPLARRTSRVPYDVDASVKTPTTTRI